MLPTWVTFALPVTTQNPGRYTGAKPTDLHVQLPTDFELLINLKTAKALDLQAPPALRLQADEVIK